ncbi:MAG: chaperone NapD [Rhodospirillales bacterium]|nr:chaperone NapD [Rhodospirillales bacterium]
MSISGLVLHVRPEQAEEVRDKVSELDGVEVHAVTDEGRLVVTVDQPEDHKAADTFTAIQNMDGVLNTSLVYNYFEQDPAEKEPA